MLPLFPSLYLIAIPNRLLDICGFTATPLGGRKWQNVWCPKH